VCKVGGQLALAGDKVRVRLPLDCSLELKDAIRRQKIGLLRLLNSAFLIVESRVLNEIVFFVPDEATKQLLIVSGARRGKIYTRNELQVLVERRPSPKELRLIHEAKQRFTGTVRS